MEKGGNNCVYFPPVRLISNQIETSIGRTANFDERRIWNLQGVCYELLWQEYRENIGNTGREAGDQRKA
jgi:hypothetical protein